MTDLRWKRVSVRRYAAQFSLCILAVYISSLLAQTPCPTAIIWGSAPYIALIFSFATQFGPPGIPASEVYCSITTVVLLYLDKAATTIGKTAEPSFEDSSLQHHAVHFALAFFVLSELEYHRQFFAMKGVKSLTTSSWRALIADADPTFDVSRQPRGYWYLLPLTERSEHEPEGTIAYVGYWLLRVYIFDGVPFHLVGGCFNYVIKRMVNPSPAQDYEAISTIGNANVFFNTKNQWTFFLGLWVLSRVVRQANFITAWGVLRASASALTWWSSKDTSSSYLRPLPTQDPEADRRLLLQSQTAEKSHHMSPEVQPDSRFQGSCLAL